jgi:hypothetical protein
MRTETKIKLKRVIELIHSKCHNGATVTELVAICGEQKISRAIPTFMKDIGVLVSQNNLRIWSNPKSYSLDQIVEKLRLRQRESGRESSRRQRARELLYGKESNKKSGNQPLNLFKGEHENRGMEPSHYTVTTFPDSQEKSSVKSVSEFLHQIPIETIITHIQSKGFIVLKP